MDESLTSAQRRRLLEIARQAIAARLQGGERHRLEPGDLSLGQGQGAFVTLHLNGRLRGCIGLFEAKGSLAETVQEMALAAAFNDPRFPPLRSLEELRACDLEISVLSPLRPTDPAEVAVGRHGIYVVKGFHRGVLLPQVATEYGWDRETFLDQTCLKAGLRAGCWRDAETTVLSFTAEVFGEKEGVRGC